MAKARLFNVLTMLIWTCARGWHMVACASDNAAYHLDAMESVAIASIAGRYCGYHSATASTFAALVVVTRPPSSVKSRASQWTAFSDRGRHTVCWSPQQTLCPFGGCRHRPIGIVRIAGRHSSLANCRGQFAEVRKISVEKLESLRRLVSVRPSISWLRQGTQNSCPATTCSLRASYRNSGWRYTAVPRAR